MTDGSLTWVKSSYSGSQGGNCVEVAAGGAGRGPGPGHHEPWGRGAEVHRGPVAALRRLPQVREEAAVNPHIGRFAKKAGACRQAQLSPVDLRRAVKDSRPGGDYFSGIYSPSSPLSSTGGAGSERTRRSRGPVAYGMPGTSGTGSAVVPSSGGEAGSPGSLSAASPSAGAASSSSSDESDEFGLDRPSRLPGRRLGPGRRLVPGRPP